MSNKQGVIDKLWEEQVRQELANWRSSCELLELDVKQLKQERDELVAKLNEQRKAYRDIEKTHQKSLQQHDNEVIDKCARKCAGQQSPFACLTAIRALKTGENSV